MPFFREPGVEERDGPLPEARGLLIDMAQTFEALDVGFGDQAPLKMAAIDDVMANILQPAVDDDGSDGFSISKLQGEA